MNTRMLRRARQLFNSSWVPPEHNRSYQRQWIRQIRNLGDKWLLAKSVERRTDAA